MEGSLLVQINKRYEAAKVARRAIDRDIKLNIAFYEGNQWVTYDANFNKVVNWLPPKGKPRVTTNLIMPVVRIEFAKITRNDPAFSVIATTPSQDDVAKARICSRFLEYKWAVDDYATIFKQALLWALVAGTGFVKVYYDPNAGSTYSGTPLGDVVIDYCSPLEMFIDPLARSLDEASWVIHERVRSAEYVETKYGVKVPAEPLDRAVMHISGFGTSRTVPLDGRNYPVVCVREYWERPSTLHPRGVYAVVAGNKILYKSDNPYADVCPIPFVSMVHIPSPGSLFGSSAVTQLRQINVTYNKLKSDIVENSTKLSNPPILAPVNAFLKAPEYSPGEVIYYNPLSPGKIDQLKFEPYPPQLVNTLIRLLQERDDVSGINDVSRGITPRGVRSGEALAYLLEQDETRLAVTARHYERMIEQAMEMVLRLARTFYDIPRVIRLLGTNNELEVSLFKATDIPPDADVHVDAGSTLPKSQTQLQSFLMELWDRKIITDPRLVLRLTHYGSSDEIINDLELDTSQALRENSKMASGVGVVVEDFHNHAIHLAEHNRFRKTVDFEKLPAERRDLFKQHVEEHKRFIEQGGAFNGAGQGNTEAVGAGA